MASKSAIAEYLTDHHGLCDDKRNDADGVNTGAASDHSNLERRLRATENPSISPYREFLSSKTIVAPSVGFEIEDDDLLSNLYPFQRDLVRWSLRKGRSAIFADTGLGKTLMQLDWAWNVFAYTNGPVLILAPLAVAQQTVAEGRRWGYVAEYVRDGTEITGRGVWITNYERLHRFNDVELVGIVLDESSILKNFSGKTKKQLIERFRQTHYRLCCTATPAPNDVVELCNHADFLGVMSPAEMISTFFLSVGSRGKDEGKFRLKRHARKDFFRWLASWAMAVRKPSDLGYADDGYVLPELSIKPVIVETGWKPADQLFATGLHGIQQRAEVRRDTIGQRVAAAVELVKQGEWDGRGTEESSQAGVPQALARSESRAQEGLPRSNKREEESAATGTICTGRTLSRQGQETGAGVAGRQPGEEEGTADQEGTWTRSERLHRSIDRTGQSVCDLRVHGSLGQELLPSSGSLSPNREGPGTPVHELQSGTREVQGRSGIAAGRDCLPSEKWLIWCGLNDEQTALLRTFQAAGLSCVSIDGTTPIDKRIELEESWRLGDVQILISKPAVFGFGMNWQHCARMAFVGIGDSYETYYQSIRRCWRYGQPRPVHAYVVIADAEADVYHNVLRKEQEAAELSRELVANVVEFERGELTAANGKRDPYEPRQAVRLPSWLEGAAA